MAINENWNIRSRAHACFHTGVPFTDGEAFVTVLMEDGKSGELVRRDYSLGGWAEVEKGLGNSFSVWRSEYEAVKSEGRPEITEKESAETLLRRLCEEDSITTENTRYILAVMLERKKQLKQTGTRETEEATFLVYEHPKSGEVYIIRDPELKLAQIEEVQKEVSRLLSGGGPVAAAEEGVPAKDGAAADAVDAAEGADRADRTDETDETAADVAAVPTTHEARDADADADADVAGADDFKADDALDLSALTDPDEDAVLESAEGEVEGEAGDVVEMDEVPAREVSGQGVISEEMDED